MMFELRLLAPAERVEVLSDALEELGAMSVSVEDADADGAAEQALFGEPGMPPPSAGWSRSTLTALFAQQDQAQSAALCLQLQDFFDSCSVLSVQALAEQDWVRLTQSQFDPVAITPDFWIVPSWHDIPTAARHAMRLDPGLAFGTGTHPTTRMCLKWLAQNPLSQCRVLDYGCGSGILAIAAGLLGAHDIDAVDIDPDAVSATLSNAKANGVQLNAGLPDQAVGPYDVVLANILATPLRLLAPLLCGLLAPGGRLVLAGILSRQEAELQAAYASVDLKVIDEQEGWICMAATRAS